MNNYALTEEIGRGKYSIVYKGRKKKSIQYHAIKSVDKIHKEKVLNEVCKIFFWSICLFLMIPITRADYEIIQLTFYQSTSEMRIKRFI